MPLTKIHAPEEISLANLQALAAIVQSALVHTCQVPLEDVFQLITQYKAGHMLMDPQFGGVSRSPAALIIEIVFLQGRSDQQKRALYHQIAGQAQTLGMRADDIIISLIENGKMDWSLGRGLAYLDVQTQQALPE